MIIDFHTHFFPDNIAHNAIKKLSEAEGVTTYTDGTASSLLESSANANVGLNVYLPVVTKPTQTAIVNRTTIEINEKYSDCLKDSYLGAPGIYAFGAIHPDNEDYKAQIDMLVSNNVKGIKLHPLFQNTNFDDIRYKRIVSYATEKGMAINVHAGSDLASPEAGHSEAEHIIPILRDVKPDRLIVAHMGGWNRWGEANKENILRMIELGAILDTSFSLWNPDDPKPFFYPLSIEDFHLYVDTAGVDKIIFGTDSPWTDQTEALRVLRKACRSEDEYRLITEINPSRLLGL